MSAALENLGTDTTYLCCVDAAGLKGLVDKHLSPTQLHDLQRRLGSSGKADFLRISKTISRPDERARASPPHPGMTASPRNAQNRAYFFTAPSNRVTIDVARVAGVLGNQAGTRTAH